MTYKYLLITLHDPLDTKLTNEIAEKLNESLPKKVFIRKAYLDREASANVEYIVDLIFNIIITVMMFLCFFSLVSSMSSNLYE